MDAGAPVPPFAGGGDHSETTETRPDSETRTLTDIAAEFDEASCAIGRHAQQLGAIEQQVVQLRQRLAQVEDVPLGRLIESDAGTFVPP